MENTIYFKQTIISTLLKLNVNEFKFIYTLLYYFNKYNKTTFINSADNREILITLGFKRTSIRINNILNSLVVKKLLIKDGETAFYFNPAILSNISLRD